MAHNVGLVLSGGGAKGAYEIGVWMALDYMGALPYIDGIYGTSVGALNAALLETCGVEKATDIWLHFTKEDFFNPGVEKYFSTLFSHVNKIKNKNVRGYLNWQIKGNMYLYGLPFLLSSEGLAILFVLRYGLPFTQERISNLIRENIDFNHQNRTIVAFCMESTTPHEVRGFDLQQYDHSVRRQILLASSALPFFYQGMKGIVIEGRGYFDGGADIPYVCHGINTPTLPMARDGWKKIITVWLDYEAKPDESIECEQVNIIPSSEEIGQFFTGTIKVNQEKIKRDIDLGFHDTWEKRDDIKKLIEM